MKWTKEKPSKEGWYWKRLVLKNWNGKAEIVRIFRAEHRALVIEGGRGSVKDMNFEWSGPIPEPEEE